MAAGQDSPHPSSPLLLEARGVSKSYPGVQALSDVSLALAVGETLAVVGENGAGKSTIFRIIVGAEGVEEGQVSYPSKIVIGYFSQDTAEMSGRTALQ
ncbi:MAG TPA: ATP-binding cassette domain-containing protein, partial [Gemmatales bacterium]|nr:ATP-binding cassette domain-containing protein [Gemmatales bacterium]